MAGSAGREPLTGRQAIGLVVAALAFVAGVALSVVPFSSQLVVGDKVIGVSCRAPVLEIYRPPWSSDTPISYTTTANINVGALPLDVEPVAACRLDAGSRLITAATLVWLAAVIVTVTVIHRRRRPRRDGVRVVGWMTGVAAIALALALGLVPFSEAFTSNAGHNLTVLRCPRPLLVVRRASGVEPRNDADRWDFTDRPNVWDGTNRECEVRASRRLEVASLVYWVGTYLVAVLLFTRRRRD